MTNPENEDMVDKIFDEEMGDEGMMGMMGMMGGMGGMGGGGGVHLIILNLQLRNRQDISRGLPIVPKEEKVVEVKKVEEKVSSPVK